MALRNIVKIDEDKCNGCGQCVTACAEGAIRIIDGKARLISETYCDGLGACLGHCPQDAITIEQRDATEFDEEAVKQYLEQKKQKAISDPVPAAGFVCPGMKARNLTASVKTDMQSGDVSSQLRQWPVQLHLLSPMASYLKNADLLFVADCVPFAMGNFHHRLLKEKAIAIGCPKLDDQDYYVQKLTDILKIAQPASLTVVHMEVPCCSGLTWITQNAIRAAKANMPFEDVTISLDGQIKYSKTIES
ncbi:MAG: 4Fe-4S binding protein [Sedimentisphaerales bacterium]|nr:4Fe-4S binding protein [Sedimentisphaerales bacterium]